MICLVTGGLGFLGSHLVRRLLQEAHQVRILDSHRELHPAVAARVAGAEVTRGNTADLPLLRACLRHTDVLFHFSGGLLPNQSNADPVRDVTASLCANVALLNSCVAAEVEHVVFASSGGTVYGIPQMIPISEFHPTDPVSSYGIVKLATEKYLALFERLHSLRFSALRFSNPYGEGQDPFRGFGAVASFLGAIASDVPLTVWGDGNGVRDFVHISDAVDAAVRVLSYRGTERVFNIGTGEGTSINQLLHTIEDITGKKARVTYSEPRPGDVPAVVLDVARARRELLWMPRISLHEGVSRTWKWYAELLNPRTAGIS